jgi:glycosyltransferase involved in cell wall biosynthesis
MELVYNLYAFVSLSRKIKKFRPELIYERYAIFTFAGLLVAKLYKIPFILEVNAPLAFEKKKYSKLFFNRMAAAIERFVCSRSHATIVVSTPLKKIIQKSRVPEDKLVVIPNGINPETFHPNIDGFPVRQRLGLNGKIVLGFVGWMREWHGLEDLLRIYIDQQMNKQGIHLLLVGDGPALPALKEYAAQNGVLNHGITLTGAVPRKEVPKHIAAFDLALQPDVTDYACPIKLVEYMGMGKGPIAPDKPNIRELLSDDYPGLFQTGNWENMAETILKNSSSKDKARLLGDMAYQRIKQQKYFWIENVDRVLRLIS